MEKLKFKYNARSSVDLHRAKVARRVVYGVRTAAVLGVIAALWTIIVYTPPVFWVTFLVFLVFCGLIYLLVNYGEAVVDLYTDFKDDYETAKDYGVRDE